VVPLWVGSGGTIRRLLSWGPVAWVGLVSYGLYLWHFPFVVWLHIGRTGGLDGALRKLLAVAATFAAATASFYLVERPIRTARGWRLPWRQWRLRLSFLRRPLIALALVPLVMASVIEVSLASTTVPPPSRSTPVVMLVGDSVPARLEPVFEKITQPRGWRLVSVAKGACSVTGELAWAPPPENEPLHDSWGCPGVPADQNEILRTDHPDVVVWWDRWSISSFVGPGHTVVRSGTPLFWKLRTERLDAAVKRFTAGGGRVLFVATEPPGVALAEHCGPLCPLWRKFVIEHYDDIARHWNSILERYAEAHPDLAEFVSVTSVVCKADTAPCDDRIHGVPARFDGMHYTDQAAPIVVNAIVRKLATIIARR
jgi:hypothetical protein